MKAIYTVRPGLTIEVEAATQKELFKELASTAEVFGDPCCGICGETAIVPGFRTPTKGTKTYEYAEWRCTNPKCGGRLNLGSRAEPHQGELFPQRKLLPNGSPSWENGELTETNGWTRYRGDADTGSSGSSGSAGSAGPRTPPPAKPAPPADPAPDTIDPGALLTAAQREAIGTALRVSGIGRQTFLRWCGYGAPEVIPQTEFKRLLQAAQKPPKDLLAVAAVGAK